jgi:hypothetical protein
MSVSDWHGPALSLSDHHRWRNPFSPFYLLFHMTGAPTGPRLYSIRPLYCRQFLPGYPRMSQRIQFLSHQLDRHDVGRDQTGDKDGGDENEPLGIARGWHGCVLLL